MRLKRTSASEPFTRRSVAVLLLIIAMISIQSGASFATHLFPLIGARGATALRLSLAAILLCGINRPWRYPLTWRQRRVIVVYGIVLGAMNLSFYCALARIPLGVAVALEFTGPLTVALLASRQLRDVLWAALAACGLVAIVARGLETSGLDPVGVLFALIAGVCWGLYIIFGQRAGAVVPSGVATTFGMLTAACVMVPLCLIRMDPMTVTPTTLGLGLVVAVLSGALPYSLEMVALQRLPAKTFGICMSVEPAIGAVLGVIVLREHLTPSQWIGIACVMCASIASIATSAAGPVHSPTIPEVTT